MKKILVLITGITLLIPQVMLADFVPEDTEENPSNTIILDSDDSGGDITLQFGATLAESIKWNSSNLSFDFSDETLILDASNSGAGANVNIVANQGSDNDGTLRYNATSNEWEISNDGGAYNALTTAGDIFAGAGAVGLVPDPVTENGYFLSDDGSWQNLLTTKDIGFFTINGGTTGTINVTGVGFQPNFVEFALNNDIEAQNWDATSPSNDSTEQGSFGWGKGLAYDTGSGISQQAQFFSGSSNSINAHRSFSSNTEAILVIASDQNGNDVGRIEGSVSSFTSDGFNLNITTNTLSSNYVFMYEAAVTAGTTIEFSAAGTDNTDFTLDQDNTGGGNTVSLIANQGTDNDGTLRYNATTNQWEYSNDGGSFQAIGSGGGSIATDLPVVQVRQTGGYTLSSATWADITFDTTDLENDATVLEHNNTNTDRIDVKEDGIYMITYNLNVDDAAVTGTWDSRVRVNDTTVLNGSVETNSNYQGEYVGTAITFYASLTTNDYITLQAQRTSANNLTAQSDPVMTIAKMEGIKGADGIDGTDGVDGADGAPGPPGSGSTINIQEEGSAIPNTPHSALNFIGGSITAADAGGGVANITVSSSGADFEGVYTTDAGNDLDTSNGLFTITTGTNDFVVDSNDWNVTAAGALDVTSLSSTGSVNFNNATSFRIHEAASDPATCTEGQLFYNTTDNYLKVCTALNTWTVQGRKVPDMNYFADTTQDTVTNDNTTDYWDGTYPSIIPSNTANEILVMITVGHDPNTPADRSSVFRVERNVGSTPTCGSNTQVGDELGFFQSDNDPGTTSAIYVDTPATTGTVYYTLCSDDESTDTGALIEGIYFTLYEINDAADLAEIYASTDPSLQAGEIVSLDPNLSAGVKRSEKSYDSKVLGVVSTKPAQLIGGTNGEGVTGVPVALSGRVPVKVSTENGPIEPGDLLTTSSIPGVAMKATEPGYIIGRAFSSYSQEDIGIILMFVGTHYADPRATW